MAGIEDVVIQLVTGTTFSTERDYDQRLRELRKKVKNGMTLSKPQVQRAYSRLLEAGRVERNASFERIATKKAVRSNSGVVVITIVTAPGPFSCPQDCHYCPNEPGQPRSYLSTEPAVARANQNDFDPVRQFYDRAGTLAKQGHTVDKVEIIVLGGTWSGYPLEYQEEFCRDLFYAANTFDEAKSKLGARQEAAASVRERLGITEEQRLNEVASVKIIGLTLETRPDHISKDELKRLRHFGCTRVQIGVQHTDDAVLKYINRGHNRRSATKAVQLLKNCGFKVDIHLMPDLPSSDPEKDWVMFKDVLHGEELQADHWKIYPCEVTPFTKIEEWYEAGKYMPYTERDPELLIELLSRVKAEVHPWIRLNRVIRDIPEVSIVAGNSNTNLRQAIFEKLKARGQSCRCIRCREVRDWPETADGLRLRVRTYRSSNGTEHFISIEGCDRGLGGGATQRALGGGKRTTKKEKKAKQALLAPQDRAATIAAAQAAAASGLTREERKRAAEEARAALAAAARPDPQEDEGPTEMDLENATLYGLLRLRLNDDPHAPGSTFPELDGSALIRELHVYGALVAARPNAGRTSNDDRPQHVGIGRALMATAEQIAAAHGWRKISVIAGVGVRNYYRRLGYELQGQGQYLVKDLPPCPPESCGRTAESFEGTFAEAAARALPPQRRQKKTGALLAAASVAGVAALAIAAIAFARRSKQSSA
eukprot:TRINITY_DN11702_c0_g2_i4.p1 TRINITY_DN11702_c0_g2~~TRINITY_DN11702_c0_g2_i4.p1  ORF type:complete len:793 (+),score=144.60 TRINITY_DN11702_c0_g2_i4:253-2379(+)